MRRRLRFARYAVPYLKRPDAACKPNQPCIPLGSCIGCQAKRGLCEDDWYIIDFYRLVSDQYVNQTPMGAGGGRPPTTTPRLEGWEAALRVYRIPEGIRPWVVSAAATLQRLHHGTERVDWYRETGRAMAHVPYEEMTDGDP